MKKVRTFPLLPAAGLGLACAVLYFVIFPGNDISNPGEARKSPDLEDIVYQRIICAAPSVTEIVFALGMGERVVGVSDFTFYPPEAKQITSIGGMINPNKERILRLQPDLIIFQGKHESLARFCRRQEIPHLAIPLDSLHDISAAILAIGDTLGAETALPIVESFEAELGSLQAETAGLPTPKVFLSLGHTPGDLSGMMTTGPGTFLHELVVLAGGENLFDDATGQYPQISKEALSKRQPDIIIEVFAEGITPRNREILRNDWKRFLDMPAVQTGNIHFLMDDFLLIPSLRAVQTARRLIEIIHPEIQQ